MQHDAKTLTIQPRLIAVIAAAAAAVTAGITAAGAHRITGTDDWRLVADAVARGLIVALPIAVALYASTRPASARFGRVLLVVCGLWFVASFANSSSSLLYSIGFVSGWLAEVGFACAMIVFPSGRLAKRLDRLLLAMLAAILVVLYLPTALLVDRYPSPAPWTSCDLRCPNNALMVASHQPAYINGFVRPLREVLTALVFLLIATRLLSRIRAASRHTRRTLEPVLLAAIVLLVTLAAAIVARRVAPHSGGAKAGVWMNAFAMPAVAAAFLVGLIRWRVFVSAAVEHVNARLRTLPTPRQLQSILAAEFEDPGLEIGSWSPQRRGWVAPDGHELVRPPRESGRWLSELRDQGRRVAAVLHDAAFRDDPVFVEAAGAAAAVAFETEHAAAQTAAMVHELHSSRARILAAADDERRRIERDLHDGAQQRLIALQIHLQLAAEKARDDPEEAGALRELGAEVQLALEEIRSLTSGIYPAVLADSGLADAVRAAARRCPVPASVEEVGLGDYPQEISTAVYFCCLESLQNIAKHAPSATSAKVVLRESNSVLEFSVFDDGPGLSAGEARVGAGIVNMRDRMATVGGQLTLDSPPGEGTRVSGRIPLSVRSRQGMAGQSHGSRLASAKLPRTRG